MEAVKLRSLTEPGLKLKVCLAGEAFTGKSSLLRRFVYDDFEDRYVSTLGTRVTKKVLELEVGGEPETVILMIWDVMGNEGVVNLMRNAFFSGARGILMVADITRPETLTKLKGWKRSVEAITGELPAYVLINKADLEEEAKITKEDVEAVVAPWGAPYVFTSAKTGENVDEAFSGLTRLIMGL